MKEFEGFKLHSTSVTDNIIYRLYFEPYGWIVAFVDDTSGAFSIQSDWGDWHHAWLAKAFGKDVALTKFLYDRSHVDYIVNKLCKTSEPDWAATANHYRQEVLTDRRQRDIDADLARELWDALDAFEHEEEHRHYDYWYESILYKQWEFPSEITRPTWDSRVLGGWVLPQLFALMRGHNEPKTQDANEQEGVAT